MIIGEKDSFAIEFNVISGDMQTFGSICYWIKNEAYGDIEQYNTLGLLLLGIEHDKPGRQVSLNIDLDDKKLTHKDIENISKQLSQGKAGQKHHNFWYNCHDITIEASEAFDGYQIFLLSDLSPNVWIIAEDTLSQRYAFVTTDQKYIGDCFKQLSVIIRKILSDPRSNLSP